jgi:hypothetical protein
MLFSAWPLFYLSQTWLAASGRMQHHRAWGVAGVSLATAMVAVGLATAIASMTKDIAGGHAEMARAFFIVPFISLLLFAVLTTWAIVVVKSPEVHKRLMTLATMAILQAPLARFFFIANFGAAPGMRVGAVPPAPVLVTIPPSILVGVLVLVAIVYDWRNRGRPHPAYLIGGGAVVGLELLSTPLSATPQWLSIADYFAGFAHYT